MLASRYTCISASHTFTNEADADELCASTISADHYSSNDEKAPDLEVEASPPQHENSTDVDEARRDADASYFSEYAGEARRDHHAVLLPPPPLGSQVKKVGDACSRKLLPHLCSDGNSAQAVTDVVNERDVDGFGDVEYEFMVANHRNDSSPAPAPTQDAAGHLAKMIGPSPSLKSRGECGGSWLDPLHALSTPYSKDPVAVQPKKPKMPEDMSIRHQGLPHPPPHTCESRFQRRTDTVHYRGGASSVTLRGSTVTPSPSSVSERNDAASCTDDQDAREYRRANYVSPSRPSALATADAVHMLSLTDVLTHGNHEGCDGGKETSAATPTAPPRVPPHHCDARVRSPPAQPLTVTVTPPKAQQTCESDNHMCAIHPDLDTTALMGSQTRVVRDRPPRGVPLILQCTGHFQTPTRTIFIDDTMMEEDPGDGGDTVTAGPHTSVYKETGDRSDRSYSSSLSVDGVELRKGGGRGRHGGCDASNCSPEPGPGMLHSRTCQLARSASPLVSLTDAQSIGGDPVTVAYLQPQPESHHRDTDTSPSLPRPKMWEEEENTVPDLIDFSVHTDELEPSQQDESLILCGYSVEPISVSRDTSAAPEARPHHQVPLCRSYNFSATGATASVAALSVKGRGRCVSSRDVEQLQVEGEVATNGWAWPQAGGASWPPQPSHLECDVVQTVPQTYPRQPSRETYPFAGLDEDLPHTSSPALHGLRHPIEYAEETPAHGHNFHRSPRITDVLGEGARVRDSWSFSPSFHESRHVNNSAECVQTPPLSSSPATRLERSSLTLRREGRKTLQTLFARQMHSPTSSRCTTMSHGYTDARESVHSSRLIAPAVDYVATQEQLRGQRIAAEEERARLSLALDVCEAVRPHARDLLLMFLLLVEESNMQCRHRRQGQVQCRSTPTSDHRTSCGSHLDSTVWEESRVTYGTCAEAVNCVLQRHGVTRVRATRELCRRVVAWSRNHHNGQRLPTQHASLLDSLRGTADDSSVEYATFVSSVMEFSAQYPV
ncbi:hypothetical protein, conserved [Leishmania tarentolae]|uniref:Uncharacterized protein n=1 Tax=Leishmania tarentolae TaxID=5689 RepID=A0A640KA87_LEITA|nr:hypothetical protein, conserved [Leishmania tarentolae]